MVKTVIHFEFGGYYQETSSGYEWNSKEASVYSLTFNTSFVEDIKYSTLVDRICWKIGVDGAKNKLKLSYMPLVARARRQSYIRDDDDVDGYLSSMNKEECRSALYVEIDECVWEVVREQRGNNSEQRINNMCDEIEEDHEIVVAGNSNAGHEIVVAGNSKTANKENVDDDEDNVDHNEDNVDEAAHVDEHVDEAAQLVDHVDEYIEHLDDHLEQCHVIPEEENLFAEEWGDGTGLKLGQEFRRKETVQSLVLRASCDEFYDFKLLNSDTWRFVVKCREESCKWYLRVSRPELSEGDDPWVVKVYRNMHSCSRASASTNRKKKKGTHELVASLILEKYPGLLEIPSPKTIMRVVQDEIGLKVSYSTALRGKKKAAGYVRGSDEDNYKLLPSYLHVLEQINSGTKTSYLLDKDNRFKYLFVALGASIEGLKAMRKVICVDATFLKRGGVLIFAAAQDPNHHHYPIAFSVVDGEKDDSWRWFFNTLKTVVPDESELVFLSDRNASLIKAIGEVYPKAEHGYCVFHLSQNVKGRVVSGNKEVVGEKFRAIARIYNEVEFEKEYGEFRRMYPNVAVYLDGSLEEKKWARCYFGGARYNIDTTNTVESMNSVFREARKYSLLPLIDAIIQKFAEWFNKYRKEAAGGLSSRKMVPVVENEFHLTCKAASHLAVNELNSFSLEYSVVGSDNKNYLVDLKSRTCTCKRFQIDRYPCVHAIACVLHYMAIPKEERAMDIHIYDLCSKYYWLEQWALAYYRTIYPVPHQSHWVVPAEIEALTALPPEYPIRMGRHKETRHKSSGEGNRKRKRTNFKPIEENNLYKYFNCSNTNGTG